MLHTNWKGYRTIAWFGQGLLASATLLMLFRANWLAAAALGGFLLASFAFMKLEHRLPTLFDLLFVLAALINAGGWAWDLYNQPGPYDEIAHCFTIFAFTLAFGYLLFERMMASFYDHRVLFIVVIASLGIALGALWEVGEWLADFVTPKQIVSGLDDTISDLILDSAGAVVAAWMNIAVLEERSRAELAQKEREEQGVAAQPSMRRA